MKKLMFATALVASAAVFADPTAINAIGFEGYSAGFQFTTGQKELDEGGVQKEAAYGYFCFDGESDSSVVTNVGATTAKRTAYFSATEGNTNFLQLDTEGGTLWRSINTLERTQVAENDYVYSNGTARAVAATGTYLDTLVQFTVTEDDAPEVESGDKLAIWLQADNDNGKTNLMVRAKSYGMGAIGPEGEAASFVLTPLEGNDNIVPGGWYRLTVKAIANVMSSDANGVIPAFEIYVDGTPMCATNAPFSEQMVSVLSGMASEQTMSLISDNRLFPSLAEMGAIGAITALQAVGFKGTGAVDDLVWTDDDLFAEVAPTVVDFTLTLDTTDAHVDTISITTNGAEVVFDNGTAQIPSNTVVTIAAPTFTDSYVLDNLTVGGISMTDFPTNFTMEANTTVAITSTLPVLNPTVDGVSVEPANVFNTAASNKPIIYPTAPTLAGTAGVDQTITYNGVTVNVPTYYTATLTDKTVTLELNNNALPTIGEATIASEEKAAIEVGTTTFTATLTSSNAKLYYGLKTATSVDAAEWTAGALTQGTGAAMQVQAAKPTVGGNTASAGFFKVYVTDVAPVTP